jgi:predicted outer membrane repeat protein
LQSALANVAPGDQIWVADGVYKPTNDGDREIYFTIPSGVEIYGGFAGGEAALFERDWLSNPTILSGDIGQEEVKTDNSYNIVVISETTTSSIFDGFTVSDGNTTGSGAGIYGGRNANATLSNLIIRDNNAEDGGGLYLSFASSPILTNVTFIDNFASDEGGAISSFSAGDLFIENGVFVGNEAQKGGAIQKSDINKKTIIGSIFYNNQAAEGSAIYNSYSNTYIQNINENFSESFNEEGLAFYVYGVGEDEGTTFYRFQNEDKPGTYLFAGPEERQNILENFPNFTEEGAAFEVGI